MLKTMMMLQADALRFRVCVIAKQCKNYSQKSHHVIRLVRVVM